MRKNQISLERRRFLKALGAIPTALLPVASSGFDSVQFSFSCRPENDLWRVATAMGIACQRYGMPDEAISHAPDRSAVLILAEGYPKQTTPVTPWLYKTAAQKKLRLYVEFPALISGFKVAAPQRTARGKNRNILDRAVIASDAFAPPLKQLRIMALHDCRYVPVAVPNPDVVLARVAGFDTAVYGLPKQGVHPILFRHGNILIATTKLSNFISGRYDPPEAWKPVWQWVFHWLSSGRIASAPSWEPLVRPAYGRNQQLAPGAELNAFRHGIQWYSRARLFVAPQWKDLVAKYCDAGAMHAGPGLSWALGDGSDGVLEGFSSNINWDGSQPVGWHLRNDCTGETAMAMAFSSAIDHNPESRKIAVNLNDFIYFNSELAGGPRNDPRSSSFGLVGWNVPTSPGIYYGDDNARSLLGTMATAGLLGSNRWSEKVLRCLLANLRTTGQLGFRPNSLTESELQKLGWRHFYNLNSVNYHPHYEAYLWVCFLRAYAKTHYKPFLERSQTAIRMTMAAYPKQWRWSNGFQQERARMLLALAWLVRIENTSEHRQWLRRIAQDLLAFQDVSGAIREDNDSVGIGKYPPPKNNEQYGTAEASLLQRDGNPVTDLLYTANFAFLGLHEAAAATGDPFYQRAEDRLAKFFCRIQIQSKTHPELAGGWFRAFDFGRWGYWASNSDWGWGAWSIETGWTQSWICAVMGMRHLRTSLWDVTGRSNNFGPHLQKLVSMMFS